MRIIWESFGRELMYKHYGRFLTLSLKAYLIWSIVTRSELFLLINNRKACVRIKVILLISQENPESLVQAYLKAYVSNIYVSSNLLLII
jgi:hypothetical protein